VDDTHELLQGLLVRARCRTLVLVHLGLHLLGERVDERLGLVGRSEKVDRSTRAQCSVEISVHLICIQLAQQCFEEGLQRAFLSELLGVKLGPRRQPLGEDRLQSKEASRSVLNQKLKDHVVPVRVRHAAVVTMKVSMVRDRRTPVRVRHAVVVTMEESMVRDRRTPVRVRHAAVVTMEVSMVRDRRTPVRVRHAVVVTMKVSMARDRRTPVRVRHAVVVTTKVSMVRDRRTPMLQVWSLDE
jgi:uncharacterized protein (UPF0147 family)